MNNRVQRIRRFSNPTQWHFVSTDNNPADHATRFISAARLKDTMWLSGPALLSQPEQTHNQQDTLDLVNPEQDVDVRPLVSTLSTTVKERLLGSQRFCRFSSWKSLTRVMSHPYSPSLQEGYRGFSRWLQRMASLHPRSHGRNAHQSPKHNYTYSSRGDLRKRVAVHQGSKTSSKGQPHQSPEPFH